MNVLDSKAPFIMGSLLSDNFPTQISGCVTLTVSSNITFGKVVFMV
jgi:hypothetical protein